ncbi:YybH family protein [Chryseobacterium populi]|uniref:Ketosteroid isomerase-like enzyme n=1 Tax=Chryseobacterium populi TaxID=1144316 RepID=J2SZW7_9FLAO|nr:DUF4440 domain-containing protein [Chryseobacterium populi]EJL71227.1 ketosteroid isomerase-like enzyme [Chryseobacterium populi]
MKKTRPTVPEEMNACFAAAYNSGNIERIANLFERGAITVTIEGRSLTGEKEVRTDHINLLGLDSKMTSVNQFAIRFENIALLRAGWYIDTVNKDGKPISINGSSSEVVRQRQDGTWFYIIDHPFGNTI